MCLIFRDCELELENHETKMQNETHMNSDSNWHHGFLCDCVHFIRTTVNWTYWKGKLLGEEFCIYTKVVTFLLFSSSWIWSRLLMPPALGTAREVARSPGYPHRFLNLDFREGVSRRVTPAKRKFSPARVPGTRAWKRNVAVFRVRNEQESGTS